MSISAYPLQWPEGWPRTVNRKDANFGKKNRQAAYPSMGDITIYDATERLRYEIGRLGINAKDDMVVSTNLRLNMSGTPRSDQGDALADPGVAVYWQGRNNQPQVIAIDIYRRVRDNIAAAAAALEAMRAIERHGGARVMERAFTGFVALPAPTTCWKRLGINPPLDHTDPMAANKIKAAHKLLVLNANRGQDGSVVGLAELNIARDEALKIVGAS